MVRYEILISIKDLEEIVMGQLNDIDANNVINMVTLELDFIVSPNQPAMTQAVCVFYK